MDLTRKTGWVAAALLWLLVGLAPCATAQDCGSLFDPGQVLEFQITMDPADWSALRVSCPGGLCGPKPYHYWNATFRCEDGPEIVVGIRRKNGTAEPSESDPQKPALKIDINEFVQGQTYFGKTKLNLENGGGSAGPPPEGEGEGAAAGGGGGGLTEGVSWLLYNNVGIVTSRVAWVRILVNGEYIGLYMNVEQVDKAFLFDHGIDENGWLFKGPGNEQRTRESEPNPFAFNWYPFDHVNPAETPPTDWHDQTEWRVDMPQLFKLAAVTNFVANKDAVVFKNNNYWFYDWSVFPDGQQPRLYLGWDLDTTMKSQDSDLPVLGVPTNNGHMAQGLLRDDAVFQAQYYQAYGDLMNGPLSLASTLATVNALEVVISADLNADPNQSGGGAAGQFQAIRDFLQARTTFVLGELGGCPDAVCDLSETSCTCPADCGAPPSIEGSCTDMIDDDCDGPIDCSDSDCVADAACASEPAPNEVVVNEIVANSPESPDVEFIEILNNGPGVQDMTGWYVLDDDNGHDPCLLEGTLQPGEYLVVAGRIDDFTDRYPESIASLNPNPFNSDVSGQGFGLGDDGDGVRLFRPGTPDDQLVDGHAFGPQSEEIPFGFRPEIADAPEYLTFPTPGVSNDATAVFSPICINEFQTTSAGGGIDDWIELYNRGTTTVDIGGWHLSDSTAQPTKYQFAPGTTMPPGSFLTLDEIELGFSFSSSGSEIILLTAADGTTGLDYYDYAAQSADITEGRFPDGAAFWSFFGTPSRGLANACRVDDLFFQTPIALVWSPLLEATQYDVVRGDLGLLQSTGGNYSAAITACASNDTSDTTLPALENPASGQGVFYLVRAVDPSCEIGTYDALSFAQSDQRDPEIQGAPATCP